MGVEGVLDKKWKGKKDVGVGIHPLIKVFSVGEKVGDGIGMSRDMFEAVIKILQEFHPLGLSAHDFLWLLEIL